MKTDASLYIEKTLPQKKEKSQKKENVCYLQRLNSLFHEVIVF